MDAVILAGGKGSRLRAITGDVIPKPMVDLLGKPMLEHQVMQLVRSGFDRIHLVVGFLHEVIVDHFGDGGKFGVDIDYIVEDEPLGTAGGLFYLKNRIDEPFALVFGDLCFDVDWSRFFAFHAAQHSFLTLFAHPNSHPADSDIVLLDEKQRVNGFLPKNESRQNWCRNLVNAGLYVVSPNALEAVHAPTKLDLESDILPIMINDKQVFAYRSTEYVKDAGTPERLASVARDFERGIPASRNLQQPQRAVFLDRDGTINVHKGFLKQAEEFELEAGAADAIRMLNEHGFLCIVATNQPAIARGECRPEALDEIHAKMETLLGEHGAYLDDVLFCPHHPDSGFDGEVIELKGPCKCRKPATGMIDAAIFKYHIDAASSWTVGDTTMDIQTGANAGTRTALVLTGEAGEDGKYSAEPEIICDTLLDFAEYVSEGGVS